ncbi:MAG: hypothetical protein ABSB76_12705 [Streptosporangiaceae bacterium]
MSWLLLLIRPESSYRLNADFEDHDERIHKLASLASMSAPRFGHPGPQSASPSAQDEPARG